MNREVEALVNAYTIQLVQSGRVEEAKTFRLSVNVLGEARQTERNVMHVILLHDQGLAM